MSKLQQSHILLATQGLREWSEDYEAQNCASEGTVVVGKNRNASERNKLVYSYKQAAELSQLSADGEGLWDEQHVQNNRFLGEM